MTNSKRILYIILGPVILLLSSIGLASILTPAGAKAMGILLWMVFWWITRPVHMAVTSLVPIIANGLLNIIPMDLITSQYFSSSIILIFGSGLLSLPWAITGLDKRVSLKILSLVGPSIKSQITVWLLASMIFSTTLPNVAVCALFTPIAVSMLAAAGHKDISKSKAAVPILLSIGWGVGLGGVGSPLGGAMNVAAISFFEDIIGKEFMYFDWVIRVLPFFIISMIVSLLIMFIMFGKTEKLEGTKEYFVDEYRKLGKMSRDEIICAVLFILAFVAAFTRPLYDKILPGLAPAYVFLTLGSLAFVLTMLDKKPMMTWEHAQANTMWGMMILFGGGLALGKLINESGAGEAIAGLVSKSNFSGELASIIIFAVLARVIGELTNSTVAAAVTVPIVLQYTTNMGLNPIPYWFITILAYNAEFMLPISVRAIPVGYGLNPSTMFKKGFIFTVIHLILAVGVGYFMMKFWPMFSTLSNM